MWLMVIILRSHSLLRTVWTVWLALDGISKAHAMPTRLRRYHPSPWLFWGHTRQPQILGGAWWLGPLRPALGMCCKLHYQSSGKTWLSGSRGGEPARYTLMGQGNQNFHVIDGEEAWLAMKHPLIPVLINLVSECDDITLFKPQFPFIFRFKVV